MERLVDTANMPQVPDQPVPWPAGRPGGVKV
jgi:hypothetical protein